MTVMTAHIEQAELRSCIDADEAPLCYPDARPDPENLAVEIAGLAALAALVIPIGKARGWAGELFDAVSVAYRELTGDLHALSDDEIAVLTKIGYDPSPGIHVSGDECSPARVRFRVVIDVLGISLGTGRLRAAIVAALQENVQTDHIAVSEGQPVTGTAAP
ncbi:MAG: hypothetical protein M0Z93_09830 [Actinomycetota bacterium]|jgi:hypothetical protein|nr:hypothetical protein [Actinomycetota bacterium]